MASLDEGSQLFWRSYQPSTCRRCLASCSMEAMLAQRLEAPRRCDHRPSHEGVPVHRWPVAIGVRNLLPRDQLFLVEPLQRRAYRVEGDALCSAHRGMGFLHVRFTIGFLSMIGFRVARTLTPESKARGKLLHSRWRYRPFQAVLDGYADLGITIRNVPVGKYD